MEMMYTALTRFKGSQGKTYLLVQGGIETLEQYRRANSSETNQRNTYLFNVAVRDDIENIPYAENRIHRTKNGFMVRSKSEVIVANEIINAGIQLTDQNYEAKLYSKNGGDYKLPDFTFAVNGKTYYWEHLGMLSSESYKNSWERKKQWYNRQQVLCTANNIGGWNQRQYRFKNNKPNNKRKATKSQKPKEKPKQKKFLQKNRKENKKEKENQRKQDLKQTPKLR